MTRVFCDICGKEMDGYEKENSGYIDISSPKGIRYTERHYIATCNYSDVCPTCLSRVIDEIERMKIPL